MKARGQGTGQDRPGSGQRQLRHCGHENQTHRRQRRCSGLAAALDPRPLRAGRPGKLVFDGCQGSRRASRRRAARSSRASATTGAVAFSADGRSAYASFPTGSEGSTAIRSPASSPSASASTPPARRLALSCPGRCRRRGSWEPLPTWSSPRTAPRSTPPAGGANAGEGRPTLLAFQRDPASGQLTFVSCNHSSYGAEGDLPSCAVGNFQEARQVESSLDGRAIYLLDWGCADNTGDCFADVVAYERNPQTSVLGHGPQRPGDLGPGTVRGQPGGRQRLPAGLQVRCDQRLQADRRGEPEVRPVPVARAPTRAADQGSPLHDPALDG